MAQLNQPAFFTTPNTVRVSNYKTTTFKHSVTHSHSSTVWTHSDKENNHHVQHLKYDSNSSQNIDYDSDLIFDEDQSSVPKVNSI